MLAFEETSGSVKDVEITEVESVSFRTADAVELTDYQPEEKDETLVQDDQAAESAEDEEQKPTEGEETKPDEGEETKPSEGEETKPDEGEETKPSEGEETKPDEGEETKPDEGKEPEADSNGNLIVPEIPEEGVFAGEAFLAIANLMSEEGLSVEEAVQRVAIPELNGNDVKILDFDGNGKVNAADLWYVRANLLHTTIKSCWRVKPDAKAWGEYTGV